MLSVILNVAFAYCFSEHYYAECQYAECRYAESRGAIFITDHWVGPIFQGTNFTCTFTASAHNHLSLSHSLSPTILHSLPYYPLTFSNTLSSFLPL